MTFIEEDLQALKLILTSLPRAIALVLLTGIFTYLYFVLTGAYILQYHALSVEVTTLNVLALILISFLSSLLIITFSYSFKTVPVSFTGILGMIISFFTTSCGCQSLWLLSLGLTVPTLSFFREITDYIQIISIILLLISLHVNLNRIIKCEKKLKRIRK